MLAVTPETADPAFGVPHAKCTDRKRRAGQRLSSGRSSRRRRSASGPCSYLFDGIDHPLRIARPGASTNYYYYELDLAGNVRGLRASGGASLGGYRYSAFGQTVEDTSLIAQPLRWKGRWFSPVAGGTYDVRARQWSPELGVFLEIDEFQYQDSKSTLWGWPNQSPSRFVDPSGRAACDGRDPDWKRNKHNTCITKCFLAAAVCYYVKQYTAEFCGQLYTNCITACGPDPGGAN